MQAIKAHTIFSSVSSRPTGAATDEAHRSNTKLERFGAARVLWATWQAWRVRRRDVAHLQSMDERMLKDIGLARSEIGTAVRFGRYWG